MEARDLATLREAVAKVHVSDALLDYLQALVRHTRAAAGYESGLSPRAALGLKHAAQAWALLAGRPGVLPEDLQAVLPGVVGHRLKRRGGQDAEPAAKLARELLTAVPIP
jgi:MoxR-like ATPase